MSEKEINRFIISFLINLAVIGFLIAKVWNGNDKAILMVIFFYPLLILFNGVMWMLLRSKAFQVSTIALLVLFLPVLLIATMY